MRSRTAKNPGRRSAAAATVALALALAAGLTFAADAPARVTTCAQPTTSTGTVGWVRSVRNMSCAAATGYYRGHHGDQNVPIAKGRTTHIGSFVCSVYQDLTPPGPSDTWVRIRCVNGRHAFRVEYGV